MPSLSNKKNLKNKLKLLLFKYTPKTQNMEKQIIPHIHIQN